MSFITKHQESNERIYSNLAYYQHNGKELIPECYGAVKNGAPVKIDPLTARRVAEKVDKTLNSEKLGTIVGCFLCAFVVLVSLGVIVANSLNGFKLIILIPVFLAAVFLFAFVKVYSGYKKRVLEYDAITYAVKHGNYTVTDLTITEKRYFYGGEGTDDDYYVYCGDLILSVPLHAYNAVSVGSKITAAIINAEGIEYFFNIGYNDN